MNAPLTFGLFAPQAMIFPGDAASAIYAASPAVVYDGLAGAFDSLPVNPIKDFDGFGNALGELGRCIESSGPVSREALSARDGIAKAVAGMGARWRLGAYLARHCRSSQTAAADASPADLAARFYVTIEADHELAIRLGAALHEVRVLTNYDDRSFCRAMAVHLGNHFPGRAIELESGQDRKALAEGIRGVENAFGLVEGGMYVWMDCDLRPFSSDDFFDAFRNPRRIDEDDQALMALRLGMAINLAQSAKGMTNREVLAGLGKARLPMKPSDLAHIKWGKRGLFRKFDLGVVESFEAALGIETGALLAMIASGEG